MIPIFKNNKLLGYLDRENNRYITKRDQKHFFNKFKGFGLSIGVIDILKQNLIENVLIIFEGREALISSVDSFLVHGIEYIDNSQESNKTGVQPSSASSVRRNNLPVASYENKDSLDTTHDKQLILPIRYFNRKIKNQEILI